MATNLRLSEAAAAAVREEAERSGRSQQDVIRDAVDKYLGVSSEASDSEARAKRYLAKAQPPEIPFMTVPEDRMLKLPEGVTSLDLLDREDRI